MVIVDKNNFFIATLNEVKELFQYAHSIGLVSTNLLTLPMLLQKKINCELDYADQMAYSEFSPDWIVKES